MSWFFSVVWPFSSWWLRGLKLRTETSRQLQIPILSLNSLEMFQTISPALLLSITLSKPDCSVTFSGITFIIDLATA